MHNRIVIQPMEGCDGTADGASGGADDPPIRQICPRSGAGLIWVEACRRRYRRGAQTRASSG